MTTKQHLKDYIWLRSAVASVGPRELVMGVRQMLIMDSRLYRVEQQYQRAKRKHGIYIEALERETPLTNQDSANLKAASAVNREINQLLREWRNGRASGEAA